MRKTSKVAAAGLGLAVIVTALLAWNHVRARAPAPAARVSSAQEGTGEACTTGEACAAHARAGAAPAVKPTGQPRILAFSSHSCAACNRMAPIVAAAERACSSARDVMHVDVDEDEGAALASTYAVSSIPAWLSVDSDGNEVDRFSGVVPESRIRQAIEEVRGARCERDEPPGDRRPM